MEEKAEMAIQGELNLNDAAQRFYRFPRELPFRVSIWGENLKASPCIVNGSSKIEIGFPCLVKVTIASQGQFQDVRAGSQLFIGVYPEVLGTLSLVEMRDL